MNTPLRIPVGIFALTTLLSACTSVQPLSQVDDDVYFMPSRAMSPTSAITMTHNVEETTDTHDYFDPGTSSVLQETRSYYDVAYNDPHYYNQGRFNFGVGIGMAGPQGMAAMGWQTGWGGPGWGGPMGWGDPWMSGSMGMGYGWGSPCMGSSMSIGVGYGWGSPWMGGSMSMSYGWGMGGFYDPWCMSPWSMGVGWGYGPYWGPWGNCWNCYAPVVIGGTSNTVFGQRPTLGGGGGGTFGSGGALRSRSIVRDPISLVDPVRRDAAQRNIAGRTGSVAGQRPMDLDGVRPAPITGRPGTGVERIAPSQKLTEQGTLRTPVRTHPQRSFEGTTTPHGNFPQRESGSFDRRIGGGLQAPAGGGTRSPGTVRPR